MALPIIPTDINGADRFNQFDPSIVGLILKTTNNPTLTYAQKIAKGGENQCSRQVIYWDGYPGDYDYPMPTMGTPFDIHAKNVIIGKLTGFWLYDGNSKKYEVNLYNPIWGSKGQLIYYVDYIVWSGQNLYKNYEYILIADDGTVTGLVAACTYPRTGIYAVNEYGPNINNFFPHFDKDYPIAVVEKWDNYFKFDRGAWSATVYPQTGYAGGYTDLWIWKGYDFKVPYSENHFGLYGGNYSSDTDITLQPFAGRFSDTGIEVNYTTNLEFFGKSEWLGGYCKAQGFVISSSDTTPEKGAAECNNVEKSLNGLSGYSMSNFLFDNLSPNTTYFVRQYYIIYDAEGNETIVYKTVKTYTTLNQQLDAYTIMSSPRMITSTTLSYNLMIRILGTKQIKEIGIVAGTTANPIPNASGTIKRTTAIRKAFVDWGTRSPVIFQDFDFLTFDSLTPNTKYYLRHYIIYQDNSIFYPNCDTNLISFTRFDYVAHPEWIALYYEATTYKAAQSVPKIVFNATFGEQQLSDNGGQIYISARITDTGGSQMIARGVCYNTTGNPLATGGNNSTVITIDEAQERRDWDVTFYPVVAGLKANTKYYFRAFATNGIGTSYSDGSNELSTTTSPVINEYLKTVSPTLIKQNTAKTGGVVMHNGGSAITAKGVVWSLNPNPTVSLTTKTSEIITGSSIGPFDSVMTGLIASRNYYVRAYYTNGTETKYGEQFSFKTADIITTPIISLIDAVVTTLNVKIGMNTTDDGGADVVNKLVWAEKTSETFVLQGTLPTSGNIITLTPGEVMNNTVIIPIASFEAGKTYVFKGYADNGSAQASTPQKQFSIAAAQVAPVAGACTLGSKTNESLAVNTAISQLNNNMINEHGILINTISIATVNNFTDKKSFGSSTSGQAVFAGLNASTTYYVRSYIKYATAGGEQIVLGAQTTFTTNANATDPANDPTVELIKNSLTDNKGVFQIAVTGNIDIAQKGVVFSKQTNPRLFNASAKTTNNYSISVVFPEAKEYYVCGYIVEEVTGRTFYSNEIKIAIDNIVNDSGISLNPEIGEIYSKGTRTWKFNGEGWAKN